MTSEIAKSKSCAILKVKREEYVEIQQKTHEKQSLQEKKTKRKEKKKKGATHMPLP